MKITITIDNNPVVIQSDSIESIFKLIDSINFPIGIFSYFDNEVLETEMEGGLYMKLIDKIYQHNIFLPFETAISSKCVREND